MQSILEASILLTEWGRECGSLGGNNVDGVILHPIVEITRIDFVYSMEDVFF